MRFNEKELACLALSTSVRFDKEGCLYMYDREGKYLKRTEGKSTATNPSPCNDHLMM